MIPIFPPYCRSAFLLQLKIMTVLVCSQAIVAEIPLLTFRSFLLDTCFLSLNALLITHQKILLHVTNLLRINSGLSPIVQLSARTSLRTVPIPLIPSKVSRFQTNRQIVEPHANAFNIRCHISLKNIPYHLYKYFIFTNRIPFHTKLCNAKFYTKNF